MNYAGVLEELQSAPDDVKRLHQWWCCASGDTFRLIRGFLIAYADGDIADAISEAAEMCARMVEIERCPELNGAWLYAHNGYGGKCDGCPAEFRTCGDGVVRWV